MTRHHGTRLAGVMLAAFVASVLLPGTAAADATAAAGTTAPCDDLLVTHRPDGPTGDGAAVTITAQALERGGAGWSMVAWQVAPTTDLRVVQVVEAGTTFELGPDAAIAEGDVEELRFCGTDAGTAPATTAPAATGRTPDGAIGVAAGFATRQLAAARAGAGGPDGTSPTALGVFGATIGAAAGGVVLLLSRRSRHDDEVIR